MDNYDKFEQIIRSNKTIMKILEELSNYSLKHPDFNNYYLTAGCVCQTILNYLHGYDLNNNINDYDIVYFDSDISYEKEDRIIKDLSKLFNVSVDIKNQARVHLWYNSKYHVKYDPYKSVEEAIGTWCSTMSCIGIRLENGELVIYSPYGLDDLFNMRVVPVKKRFDKDSYDEKVKRWKRNWNKLEIIEWEEI